MILRAEHVGINVSDMEKSLRFYGDIFGFKVRRRSKLADTVELAFMAHPGEPDFEIELIAGPVMEHDEGKVNHLAFRVSNMEETVQQLREKGVQFDTPEPRTVLGDVKIIFFKGPDGEKLELVER
jgi:lactoylglutathione lyase